MKKRYIPVLVIMPVLAVFLSLFVGRYDTTAADVAGSFMKLIENLIELFYGSFGLEQQEFLNGFSNVSDETYAVIIKLRLPRAVAAAFVGAALSASGAAYQGIFHNPLVSPGLLGVSAGAGFGAALSILIFGSGNAAIYGMAFVFGIMAVIMSYWTAGIYKSVPAVMLVLGGTVISAIFNALISALKYLADTNSELPAIVYWLMGSLASVSWRDMWALVPMTAGIIIIVINCWRINILSMGDREARTLGVETSRSKFVIIVGATFTTAGAVCIAGVVGWVGLVIPHIGRMIVGNDNRKLVPAAISLGACFVIIVDMVSRSLTASELPLGILTSLIGAPFFILLIKKTKGGGWQR